MKRRLFGVSIVLACVALINGCSKCSHSVPAPPPPSAEPATEPPPPALPEDSQHLETPGDTEVEPPSPATPAFPNDGGGGSSNESTD